MENQPPTIDPRVPEWKLRRLILITDGRKRPQHMAAIAVEMGRRKMLRAA